MLAVRSLSNPMRHQAAWTHGLGPDLDWSWRTFDGYLGALGRAQPAVNCIPLVGFGALRVSAMGMADRAATEGEIALMRSGLREALAAGAWGMSTGRAMPGAYAATDEIVAVGRELRPGRSTPRTSGTRPTVSWQRSTRRSTSAAGSACRSRSRT